MSKKPKIVVIGIGGSGCKLVDNLESEKSTTPSIYHKLIAFLTNKAKPAEPTIPSLYHRLIAVDEGFDTQDLDAIKNENVLKVLVQDKKLCSDEEIQKELGYGEFKLKFREGDRLYRCNTSKSNWANLMGSEWMQLEREGEVIYTRMIAMS